MEASVRREHSLQVAVNHMLELVLDPEKTWYSAVDHAAQLSARYGAERKRRGVKRGLPDFIIIYDSSMRGTTVLGLELKVGRGALSPEQRAVRDAWTDLGQRYFVARSLEEVQETLEHCRVPMRRRMNLFSKEANHEQPAVRPQTARHKRPPRRRRPAGAVPVVLRNT
jgi:hypothetical protein